MDPWFQPAHLWFDLIEPHGMQRRCVANVFRLAKGACLFLAEGVTHEKEKQICWTGSQGEYDDPVSLSQFLILVMFHFSVRRRQSPGANIIE